MQLKGRGIVITGANQGLGKAIAGHCISQGADVLLCARNAELLNQTADELRARASPGQVVLAQVADVSNSDQVESLIQRAEDELREFTGLVNNAGVYGPMGTIEDVDWPQWVRAIEVNLLGTVLPCRFALPHFRSRGYGKIVNLSGGGATAPLPRISAYAASKAAVVRFTETVAEETRSAGIDVNAIAPGPLNTRLLDEVLEAGPEKVGADFYNRSVKQKDQGGAPLDKGAALCSFLLSAESDGITGKLLSAVWDPWATLSKRREQIEKSDVYTLRRIVPKDRGLDWE
jgi:NAD(P)-dependent dehydrogenase (short-subunit alcohol dehydrogenase family)